MNDRPDIAVAAKADGAHVGQDEFTVADVRVVLNSDQIIGVSTHSLQQANAAVSDGADYIGVGPTFPSTTKTFEEYPGLELVKQVFANIQLPAFAIGGINDKNVSEVIQVGGSRVAVTACVSSSDDPALSVGELHAKLAKR
jgi:thiamine-phosphate pyrophosphorylase